MNNQQLNEGLRSLDLKEMIYPIFEVDTFKSKMGEDRDVCVVSFTVKDRAPAKDLMEFIEKGYSFVLDADVSSGENNKGEYSVFVELSRTPKLSEEIRELCYGVQKLSGIEKFSFKYHKNEKEHPATKEVLADIIPESSSAYDGLITRFKTESVKKFFNKTLMDDLSLDGDTIIIHKPFNQRIKLKLVKEGTQQNILENNQDTIQIDTNATSEVFWLTKVIGDYSINKIGENFVLNNGAQAMLIKLEI